MEKSEKKGRSGCRTLGISDFPWTTVTTTAIDLIRESENERSGKYRNHIAMKARPET